jgi:2-polyprenyl-3-methyl-5-hydroxy-6-metoxy-1,4-benzoquinol methylase
MTMSTALIQRVCPVCGRSEEAAFLEKGGLRLVRCSSCSMVYANPVGHDFASGEYYDTQGAAYYLSAEKLQSDYAAVRFVRELKLFREHCRRGAVLDVGSSSGAFLHQLNQQFPGDYEIAGTDVSGSPLDYAESKGIPVIRGDFPAHDFGARSFDAITFWAVLEHLLEPKRFLEKAATLLKPGGYCFVLVPNLESLAVRLIGKRYRYIYDQHLNYFTRSTLKALAKERFEVLSLRSMHFNPIVIWQDWRGGGKEVSNAERGALLQRTTRYKQSPWLWPVKKIYSIAEQGIGALNLADNLAMVLKRKN